jgi:hypothetical protein
MLIAVSRDISDGIVFEKLLTSIRSSYMNELSFDICVDIVPVNLLVYKNNVFSFVRENSSTGKDLVRLFVSIRKSARELLSADI